MNVPYFIRIKDDNEKKSKKRLLAVNMYVECTSVVRLSPTVWISEI